MLCPLAPRRTILPLVVPRNCHEMLQQFFRARLGTIGIERA
ncbi:MAG: hypothetical protein ACLPLR_10205 [Terriglobales bacterium]